MSSWLSRHRPAIEAMLQPNEVLRDAERVVVRGRRRVRAVPRGGFILVVTDRRLVALRASTWLARPGEVLTDWSYDQGASLAAAPLGRLRLLLPDRTVVTLRPYGPRSVSHLARH